MDMYTWFSIGVDVILVVLLFAVSIKTLSVEGELRHRISDMEDSIRSLTSRLNNEKTRWEYTDDRVNIQSRKLNDLREYFDLTYSEEKTIPAKLVKQGRARGK